MSNEQDQEITNEVNEQPETEQTQEQNVPAEEPATESTQETGAPQEEEAAAPPDVYSMLHFMLGMLAEQAWQYMGIRLGPGQKELSKDMVQAKVAIDTVAFISDKLHPRLGEEDRKALRALVSDLQMNFVMHNK